MAFFEDLGKKITQTSQGVVQKTKDTAEVIKLSGMISDEEKRISSLYSQLGEEYYNLHPDTAEEALQSLVLEINDAKHKIEDYSEQVKKLKGVAKCPNCGNDVPYGTPFCSNCGTKLETIPEEAPTTTAAKFCAACGSPIGEDCAFCTNCGAKVAKETTPKLCPNCKCEIDDNFAFCMNCGTKL